MSTALWASLEGDPRDYIERSVRRQYDELFAAMPTPAYITYGNVDLPRYWPEYVREGHRVLDGETVEIGGLRFGFVGGGLRTQYRTPYELDDEEFARKVEAVGEVDVLCCHIPPAIPELLYDVVARRFERGSEATLEAIKRTQPRYALFGHVHQPLSARTRVGRTECLNVGTSGTEASPTSWSGGPADLSGGASREGRAADTRVSACVAVSRQRDGRARPRRAYADDVKQYGCPMADRTTSSIKIGADRSTIMTVIADFPSYPEWAGQVKAARILSTGDGPARHGPVRPRRGRDQRRIHPPLHLARRRVRRLEHRRGGEDGLRAHRELSSCRRGQRHRGDLRARRRSQGADDRHDQAEGGEGHHRHRPEGAEEARRERPRGAPRPDAYGPRHRPRRRGPHHRRGGDRTRRRPPAAPGSRC